MVKIRFFSRARLQSVGHNICVRRHYPSATMISISVLVSSRVGIILLASMAFRSRSQTGKQRSHAHSVKSRSPASRPSQRRAAYSPILIRPSCVRLFKKTNGARSQQGDNQKKLQQKPTQRKTPRKSKLPATLGEYLNNTSCHLSSALSPKL